jgi:hypothetical protein
MPRPHGILALQRLGFFPVAFAVVLGMLLSLRLHGKREGTTQLARWLMRVWRVGSCAFGRWLMRV